MGGKRFLVSSSRAQPRDLFRLPFAVFLRKSICMKHRDPQSHEAYGVSRSPLPSQLLPDRERKRFLASARNDDAGKAAFSLLPLEGGGAQRRRLASLSFSFGQPSALRASPFHGKGVDGLLIPLLPPSSGRRWRVAPEVGFALFRFQPTPALRASPFHGKGVDGLLAHSSTLHYPFTENGFQILATFIELKMNLKIGQSHYF